MSLEKGNDFFSYGFVAQNLSKEEFLAYQEFLKKEYQMSDFEESQGIYELVLLEKSGKSYKDNPRYLYWRNKFIHDSYKTLAFYAYKTYMRYQNDVTFLDLLSVGVIILNDLFEEFEPTQGNTFNTLVIAKMQYMLAEEVLKLRHIYKSEFDYGLTFERKKVICKNCMEQEMSDDMIIEVINEKMNCNITKDNFLKIKATILEENGSNINNHDVIIDTQDNSLKILYKIYNDIKKYYNAEYAIIFECCYIKGMNKSQVSEKLNYSYGKFGYLFADLINIMKSNEGIMLLLEELRREKA